MSVIIKIDREIKKRFPDLSVKGFQIDGLEVEKESRDLEGFKKELLSEIRADYSIEKLKDAPLIRLYRDFYWRIGIDPTKIRPASEALIRRVLQGKALPVINTLVDSYNLASIKTTLALAAFDARNIRGDILLRYAEDEEIFTGIGMQEPVRLRGVEPVLTDGDKTIAVYPYRDSDESKVTLDTKSAFIVVCGVPGIADSIMERAKGISLEYITRFCGGKEVLS